MNESVVKNGDCEMIRSDPPAPQNGTFKARTVSLWPNLAYFAGKKATNKVSVEDTTLTTKVTSLYPPNFGITGLQPSALFINFDRHDERVYKAYFRRQRIGVIPVIVAMSTVHAIQCLALDLVPGFRMEILDRIVLSSVAVVSVLVIFALIVLTSMSSTLSEFLAVIMWLLLTTQIFYDIGTTFPRHMPSDMIGWLLVLIFVTQMTVPVGAWLGLPIILVLVVAHSVLVGVMGSVESQDISDIGRQVAANVLLCAASTTIGFAGSLFSDRLNRRSVLEIKSALTAKAKIEVAYKNKERLLLSVLPKDVADEMLKDVGNLSDGQFRKIYMKRYENVSILFADIVGFTAISSTVTAAELIKILNELFASFDVLAHKFHQVRIKILGDCYYCICGALEARTDHAVLTIHMGLNMVEAISTVRHSTGKDVNMRVGVHTGACLGGVLGQRQWQFDVLGKEVTLANKMESGGLPARVHVSQATKEFLDGEFELENGHGGDREEELKLKNVTTYLVKAVLKQYPEGTMDKQEGPNPVTSVSNGKTAKAGRTSQDTAAEDDVSSDDDDDDVGSDKTKEMEQKKEFSRRLERELLAKDSAKSLFESFRVIIPGFKDATLETRYQQRSESYSGLPVVAICVALLLVFLAKLCVLPVHPLPVILFVVAEIILMAMAFVSMTLTFASRFPASLVRFAKTIDTTRVLKMLWGVSACVVFFISDTVPVVECDQAGNNETVATYLDTDNQACHYIVYYPGSACVVFIVISSMVNLNHLAKGCLILVVACLHSLIILVFVEQPFLNYDLIVYGGDHKHVHIRYRLLGQVICVAFALNFFNKQMEFTSRKLYLWKEDSTREKERAADLKIKNEALIYNLLPAHVAKIFLGRRKRDSELYSHSYDEVGVLFAACPNYNDFYSESAINNDGLECLRFLNEIISDYDELLNLSIFSGIVKIKTVGATYMAASGMVDTVTSKSESVREKWAHLNVLVRFALALQEVMNKINEQSFNNFILRIGINHGPIIAGVIGARKPHYDIWGNTVNVSSRMESTGQAGRIQVVEETKIILEVFGYRFEKRGLVKVKGKGELMTYFMEPVVDGSEDWMTPHQVPHS